MLTASVITDCSWILEDGTGSKFGVISYNANTAKYLLITEDMEIELDSFKELESTLGKIKIKARKTIKEVHRDLHGYAICHESAEDVVKESETLIRYTPTGKSKKEFYAGHWVALTSDDIWVRRVSLSVEMHGDLKEQENSLYGPYIDKMEANFMVKKLNTPTLE